MLNCHVRFEFMEKLGLEMRFLLHTHPPLQTQVCLVSKCPPTSSLLSLAGLLILWQGERITKHSKSKALWHLFISWYKHPSLSLLTLIQSKSKVMVDHSVCMLSCVSYEADLGTYWAPRFYQCIHRQYYLMCAVWLRPSFIKVMWHSTAFQVKQLPQQH